MNAKFRVLIVSLLVLNGCSSVFDKQIEWEYVQPETYPILKAVGYAPISEQSGKSDSIKMLQAIKASKLDAYRELTEQVYGQKIIGDQSLANLLLADTRLQASVQGVIKGAEVVKSYPIGENMYATELSLDFQKVYHLYVSITKPRRIKNVSYF